MWLPSKTDEMIADFCIYHDFAVFVSYVTFVCVDVYRVWADEVQHQQDATSQNIAKLYDLQLVAFCEQTGCL